MEQALEGQLPYQVSELNVNSYVFFGKLKRESGDQRIDVKKIDLKQLKRSTRFAKPKENNTLNFQLEKPTSSVRVYSLGNISIATSAQERIGYSVKKIEEILSRGGFPLKVEDTDLKSIALTGQLNKSLDIGVLFSNVPELERVRGEGYRQYPKENSKANFTFFPSGKFIGSGFKNEEDAGKYLSEFLKRLNSPVEEEARLEAYRREVSFPLLKHYYEYVRELSNYVVEINREKRLKGRKILETFLERKKNQGLGNDLEPLAAENIYLLFKGTKDESRKITQRELAEISHVSSTTLINAQKNLMKTVGDMYKN